MSVTASCESPSSSRPPRRNLMRGRISGKAIGAPNLPTALTTTLAFLTAFFFATLPSGLSESATQPSTGHFTRPIARLMAALASADWFSVQPASAQPPDLRAMVGRPLPVGDLPAGTVSVRLADKMPANALPGITVEAKVTLPGGELATRTAVTGEDGRAAFPDIPAAGIFQAAATVNGELLRSSRFALPPEGGIRLMLIAGIGAQPVAEDAAPTALSPASAQVQRSKPRFSIDAAGGTIEPAPDIPVGTLEIVVEDARGAPIANKAVSLAQLGKGGGMQAFDATTDANGRAQLSDLTTGEDNAYVAVVELEGFTLGSAGAIRLGDTHGTRVVFRPLSKTKDASILTVGRASKIIIELREEFVMLAQSLEFRNSSQSIFDPRPAGLIIPLPQEFSGAQPLAGGASVEVIKGSGIVMRDPVPPTPGRKRGTLARFGFMLPTHGNESVTVEQELPQGFEAPLILVPAAMNITVEGAGAKRLKNQEDTRGNVVHLYEFPDVDPGGTLRFVISGLPAVSKTGRHIATALALALLLWGVIGSLRKRDNTRRKQEDTRTALVERREKLFADLVELDRNRQGSTISPTSPTSDGLTARRAETMRKLEAVYKELAAVEREI